MIPIKRGTAAIQELLNQPKYDMNAESPIQDIVNEILKQVQQDGDQGLKAICTRLGDPTPENWLLSETEIAEAVSRVAPDTQALLRRAADNIRAFNQAVMNAIQPVHLDHGTLQVGLDWRPIERVACYVPGGRYPLPSTALMTTITAQVAGVPDICLASPQLRDETIFAGTLAGVSRFYRLGGAQAVAALAYGTETITPVDMLVGPGNAYVTEAKRQVQGVIGIDMLAGPSEVLIIADATANPTWVAADLLAQAEHDPEARAYLLTDSETLAQNVKNALTQIIATDTGLPDYLRATGDWGAIFVLPSLETCIHYANALAPEHLELLIENPAAIKPKLQHYGALFMGHYTPVPVGDYMAGTNHTLPTARTARFSGSLTPLTFLRPQSWIQAEAQAQDLLRDTASFACLEGLTAHELSARRRL